MTIQQPNPFSTRAARARAEASSEHAWVGLPSRLPTRVRELATDAALSDAELVRRSLAGQHDPFAALVARYQKRAFWIAFHVVGRSEDARDVSQEAFARLYRSLHRFDYARSFYTWFYRIVMNLAIDHLRKHKSARARSLDELVPLEDPRGGAGAAPLEQQEENAQVWQVLEKLDAKFRAVLVLRDIHGLSCREIAPILKITHATARWRLHRGRMMFRSHWDRDYGGDE